MRGKIGIPDRIAQDLQELEGELDSVAHYFDVSVSSLKKAQDSGCIVRVKHNNKRTSPDWEGVRPLILVPPSPEENKFNLVGLDVGPCSDKPLAVNTVPVAILCVLLFVPM